MASIIRIKRSSVSGNPSTLGAGELAYSNLTDNGSNGGDRLYIGMGTETNGNAANHIVIGGKYFTDRLNQTAGVLTANAAIVVDGDKKIDDLYVDNLRLNGNTITSTDADGNIYLDPDGNGYVQITGTNALIIPKGTTLQQAPAISGAIRFNVDNTAFEGYDGTNWASLGGVRSVDQLTYIKAEATPGAGDGTLYFNAKDGITSSNVMTLDKDGLKILATTTATGSNTGALQVAGGASIEGALYLQGSFVQIGGNQSSDQFLANIGAPNTHNGFSFQGDGGTDTGMFSLGDGNLQFYTNDNLALEFDGVNTAWLYTPTLSFGPNTEAKIAYNDNDTNGLRFYTRYTNQQTISPINDGEYLLLQSSNNSGDSTAGRSSLRWRDYSASHYSQVDAQYDGVWIKNADWTGSSYQQYWKFGIDGKLGLPNSANANSGLSDARFFAEYNNAIVLQPSSNTNAALHISNWDNTDRLNIWHNGGNGLIFGNYDNGDSLIEIGGSNGSWWDSADDIAIKAQRNGQIYLRTNNGDINFQNDSGTMIFRNSDAHLVIPGVIETNDTTGDVTLAASDGTERNLVFTGAGALTLPNNGIYFRDNNNINGTQVGDIAWDGTDLYVEASGRITLTSNWNNINTNWNFNTDGSTQFPNYLFPSSSGGSGQVLVDTAGNGTLTWTNGAVTIGTTEIALAGSSTTLAGLTDVTVANLNLTTNTIAATGVDTDINVVIAPKGAGYVSVSNAQLKNIAEPTDDSDAATKYYVDAARSGLDVKQSVRLATTEDITLADEQVIDTKMAVAGDRVLVKDQTLAKNNGIYVVVAGGAWTRASDFDAPQEISSGAFTFVEDGSVNVNSGFVVTTKGAITIGTTAIDWTLFSASGTLIAGDGLSKSGYTLKVNVATDGGIEINSDSLQLKSSLAGDGLSYTAGVLSVGGTADRITVNSDTIDIASTYQGQNSIITVGTITAGTWNGNSIADSYIDNNLTIDAGTIDNTPIGETTRNTAKFTSLAANGLVTFTNTTDAGPLGTAAVVLSGGLSVAKKIYVGTDIIGAGADTSTLSGFDIDGGTY